MERWTAYVFGETALSDSGRLLRMMDYLIGKEVERLVRLFPDIRPGQLRRLCLFLSGLSDKDVAELMGEDTTAVRVSRWRYRMRLLGAGREGRRLAERLVRRGGGRLQ